MHIAVVGTGYVGLVTGTCFADLGLNVTCVDVDEAKIADLQAGKSPIYEPGLDALISKNAAQGRLNFSTDLGEAISRALVVFIAVGTPPTEAGDADLSAIEAVAKSIGEQLDSYKVVVTKSTVPAGTGAWIRSVIEGARKGDHHFDVVSNPEFLREGSAIEDFLRPDRIVVGAESDQAVAILRDLYRPLTRRGFPLVSTNVETAEVIKYASNAFLATKVAFINEVAGLCEKVGADVREVASGMGLDNRIGEAFLNPGPGYGGSCFPKDTEAFAALARARDTQLRIVDAVIESNREHRAWCTRKVLDLLGGAEGQVAAVLGLSFKPDTDDIRESPALEVVEALVKAGVTVRAFDPEAMERAKEELPQVTYCDDSYQAAEGADVLVVLTEWNQFFALEFDRLREAMRSPRVVDLRNIWEPEVLRAAGFEYQGLGRAAGAPALCAASGTRG